MSSSPRAHRPFWADLRFLIGVLLVVVAIAGVWLIVSSMKSTSPALQATRPIALGEVLQSSDFRVVDVGLGVAREDYLAPEELTSGLVAARTVEAGELLPHTATAEGSASRTTTIVVESTVGVSERVKVGSAVELWQAPILEDGRTHGAPEVLVASATVAGFPSAEGMLVNAAQRIELVIDRSNIAAVLQAMTSGASISVVPAGGAS